MVQQNPKETDYSEHEVRQRATDMLIIVFCLFVQIHVSIYLPGDVLALQL